MAGIVPDGYTKTVWANDPEGGTPINATRLNNIENALEAVNEYAREGSVELANNTYPGRNLATVLADEAEAAGGIYAALHARVRAANYAGLRIGDYVDVTLTDSTVMRYQIAAFDHYYNCADQAMGHHLFMVPTTPWSANIQWNTTATNQGTNAQKNPYLVSNLHSWEVNTFLPKLPQALRDVLIDHRSLVEDRYNASSQLSASTGWHWDSLGKVFSLSEMEVYGCCVWGTPAWSQGMDSQLPLFRETRNRIKSRASWWLRVARGSSASNACLVNYTGTASDTSAAHAGVRPLPCFLIG